MNKTLKIFLVLSTILLVVFFVIGGVLYSLISGTLSRGESVEIVEQLREPRILINELPLTKQEYFKKPERSVFSAITEAVPTINKEERQKKISSGISKSIFGFTDLSKTQKSVFACGKFGCFEFDYNGNLKREVEFQPFEKKIRFLYWDRTVYNSIFSNVKCTRLSNENDGFISFDSIYGFNVYDEKGNRIWNYGGTEQEVLEVFSRDDEELTKTIDEEKFVMNGAVEDLDGDGVGEYLVSVRNDGIHAFRNDGTEIWFEKEKLPSGELLVDTFTGANVRTLAQVSSKIALRHPENGAVTKMIEGMPSDMFTISYNPKGVAEITLCSGNANKINCVSTAGKEIFSSDYPLSTITKRPKQSEYDYDNEENVYKEKGHD